MAGQKKVKTRGSRTMKQKYESQKRIKTVKNIHGLRSSNRPTISKIGIQSMDNKGLVVKSTLNNNV